MSNAFNKIVESLSKTNIDTVSELIYGEIITINPLSIKINENTILPYNFFIINKLYDIGVYEPLKINDKVVLLSFNGGQLYYIAQKE